MTDLELLQNYAATRSEDAFAELVKHHVDWIHTTARRYVHDPALAEDVTQAVFITLSRKASALVRSPKISLTGWLFTTTRYASASALKMEKRRRIHERQAATMKTESLPSDHESAWPAVESHLNAGLARLSASDREALLLRYFQNLSHESLANALRISPAAAQKRVARALDRLRKCIAPSLSVAAFTVLLVHRGVEAAPPHLASLASNVAPTARIELILKGISAMKKTFLLKTAFITVSVLLFLTGATTLIIADASAPAAAASSVAHLPAFDLSHVRYITAKSVKANPAWTISNDLQKHATLETVSAANWVTHHYLSGPDEFVFRDGGALIFKKRPLETADTQFQDLQNNYQQLRDSIAIRDPAADEIIDAISAQAYRLHPPGANSDPQNTMLVLIDPATHYPLRIISPTSNISVTYNPSLPDNYFQIPAIPNAQLTSSREYLEKKFPLDNALSTKTSLGQIFAVHEAIQDSTGCYQMICSQRLTPDARAALPPLPEDTLLGNLRFRDNVFPYRYIEIAHLRGDGIKVSYILAIPNKMIAPANRCQIAITMTSDPIVLNAIHSDDPQRRDTRASITLAIPLAANPPTPRDFLARAYDDISPLVGMLPETNIFAPNHDPGLSSKQDSLNAFDKYLAGLLQTDQSVP